MLLRALPAWMRPFQGLSILASERTWSPGGQLYVAAGMIGMAIALIGVALGNWPWWWTLIGVFSGPLILWSASMVSAFTGWSARLSGTTTRDRLRAVIRGEHPEATRRGMERLLRASPIKLFGLKSWDGDRQVFVVGSAAHGGVTVDLHHGSTREPPWLSVECTYAPAGTEGAELHLAKRSHERSLWFDGLQGETNHVTDERYIEWLEEQESAFADAPGPTWGSVVVRVDGPPITFDMLTRGEGWVALGHIGDTLLSLRGEGIDLEDLELVRLRDVSAYFEDDDPGS